MYESMLGFCIEIILITAHDLPQLQICPFCAVSNRMNPGTNMMLQSHSSHSFPALLLSPRSAPMLLPLGQTKLHAVKSHRPIGPWSLFAAPITVLKLEIHPTIGRQSIGNSCRLLSHAITVTLPLLCRQGTEWKIGSRRRFTSHNSRCLVQWNYGGNPMPRISLGQSLTSS